MLVTLLRLAQSSRAIGRVPLRRIFNLLICQLLQANIGKAVTDGNRRLLHVEVFVAYALLHGRFPHEITFLVGANSRVSSAQSIAYYELLLLARLVLVFLSHKRVSEVVVAAV